MKMRRFTRVAVLLAVAQMLLAGGLWWFMSGRQQNASVLPPPPPASVTQQRLAEVYATAAFRAVITSDYAALSELLRPSEAWPEIAYVTVEDAQGKILASSDASKVGRTWNAALAGEMRSTIKGRFEETIAALVDSTGKNNARAGQVRVAALVRTPPPPVTPVTSTLPLLAVVGLAGLAAIPIALLVENVVCNAPGMTPKEHRLLDQLREARTEGQRLRDDVATMKTERDQNAAEIDELRTSITHYLVELQKLRADAALVEAHLSRKQITEDVARVSEPANDTHADVALEQELRALQQQEQLRAMQQEELRATQQQELRAMQQEVKELQVRTVTQMAQAFRSSLTNILGYSKLLLRGGDGELSAPQQTNVSNILDAGTRLVALVNGLSEYVRVGAGMNAPTPTTVDLASVLNQALGEAQRRGRRLSGAPLPEPLLVQADARHVEQMARSLLTDAMALDPQATGRLGVTSSDGRVVVELLVSTSRVAPDELKNLLDPFGNDDASRPLDESRLRLAVARGVAEANGGHLTFHTNNPDEVAFVLDLQAAPAPVAS